MTTAAVQSVALPLGGRAAGGLHARDPDFMDNASPSDLPATAAALKTPPPPDPDQAPLLPRVAQGEAEAVRRCLQRYQGLVWSLARRTLGSGPDAEDLVQDVFIELWKKADRYDPARGK
ncbi:MAG: sigma factor [Planctomycetota bacterium]